MCGISVWVSARGEVDGQRLGKAIQMLHHRGPDSQNVALWDGERSLTFPASQCPAEARGFRVGLAHARLSIIDLSEGNDQPFLSDDGSLALVYNGEIYNYLELRDEIDTRYGKQPWRTSGDTEVLLRLLELEGIPALRRLNGMWAFALYDLRQGKVVLSRDRYGKKPLFFHHEDGCFLAASEYKALFHMLGRERVVNPEYVYGFLMGKRWPVFDDMASMYKDVSILPAGSSMVYDLASGRLEIESDNCIDDFLEPEIPAGDLPAMMADEIASAVEMRFRSDVPIGVMVSGGVDSTAVAALAARSEARSNISFYTIDVNDPDDLVYSKRVADDLGVDLIQVDRIQDDDEMAEVVAHITRQFEIPLNVALVTLPGFLVCRQMSRDGVRVALDGTGGDEVLGGYPGYYHLALENSMRAQKVGQAWRLKRMVDQREDLRTHSFFAGWLRFIRRSAMPNRRPPEKMITDSRAELFGKHASHADLGRLRDIVEDCYGRDRLTDVVDMQLFDLMRGQMPYYLYINDQVSMANSVETRSPFLDYRLIKHLRMPDDYKFRDGYNKYHLRSSILPSVSDDVRWRKSKAGFGLTPESYFEKRRANMTEEVRQSEVLRGLFDMDAMLVDIDKVKNKSHFREMIAHLHSVAVLEEQVDMRVEK